MEILTGDETVLYDLLKQIRMFFVFFSFVFFFHVRALRMNCFTAWRKRLICSLVVRQQIRLYRHMAAKKKKKKERETYNVEFMLALFLRFILLLASYHEDITFLSNVDNLSHVSHIKIKTGINNNNKKKLLVLVHVVHCHLGLPSVFSKL